MNVLSLFDGISCGQVALQRAGIKVDKYYTSEIDKYAIQVTQKNHPNTIQLGDINNWREWEIEKPDIILAGSPCQAFSFAGKRLKFDDPRGQLFFVFTDILEYYKPKYFLLENVIMDKQSENVISEKLGEIYKEYAEKRLFDYILNPVEINSALLSAQNRRRLYWFNWNIEKPEDKGIMLKDIIENGEVDRKKSYCIDANYYKGGSLKNYLEKKRRQIVLKQSEKRLQVKCGAYRGRNPDNQKSRQSGLETKQTLEIRQDYEYWRKLTPLECERLQTLPDDYTKLISNTQRYKCIGNGWTVDVIAHILKYLTEGDINNLK